MHQVGADESNQFQEAVLFFAHLLQEAQHQESDQSHGDLDADRVLGTANEMSDFQRLFMSRKNSSICQRRL